ELARVIARAKCGASVQTAERLQWWIEDLRRWTLLRSDMGFKARTLFEARSNPNTWLMEWQSLLSALTSTQRTPDLQAPRQAAQTRSGGVPTSMPSRNQSRSPDVRSLP